MHKNFWLIIRDKIAIYSLDQIFEADEYEEISPLFETRNKFEFYNQTSFAVLNKGDTIIGIEKDSKKKLLIETFSNGKSQIFGERKRRISTIIYHESTNTLLVGGFDNKLIQYKQDEQSGKWIVYREFKDLDFGFIDAFVQVGNLLIFEKYSKIIIFNVFSGKVIRKELIREKKYFIESLQVCHTNDSKFYLSIGKDYLDSLSHSSDFLDSQIPSDLLDITLLVEKHHSKLDQLVYGLISPIEYYKYLHDQEKIIRQKLQNKTIDYSKSKEYQRHVQKQQKIIESLDKMIQGLKSQNAKIEESNQGRHI